ncbi:hypothetical protein B0H14DRAFT_2568947 [Mycena olivaceomarginata]|nr:hypothetical protein B0H14DRAFT_2568947 [Mycena olivaceomarginata]
MGDREALLPLSIAIEAADTADYTLQDTEFKCSNSKDNSEAESIKDSENEHEDDSPDEDNGYWSLSQLSNSARRRLLAAGRCSKCKRRGHIARNCPTWEANGTDFEDSRESKREGFLAVEIVRTAQNRAFPEGALGRRKRYPFFDTLAGEDLRAFDLGRGRGTPWKTTECNRSSVSNAGLPRWSLGAGLNPTFSPVDARQTGLCIRRVDEKGEGICDRTIKRDRADPRWSREINWLPIEVNTIDLSPLQIGVPLQNKSWFPTMQQGKIQRVTSQIELASNQNFFFQSSSGKIQRNGSAIKTFLQRHLIAIFAGWLVSSKQH